MLNSLEQQFGRGFEESILRVILFDSGAAERMTVAVSDESLFNSAINKEIAATYSRLASNSTNGLPTYKSVVADMNGRLETLRRKGAHAERVELVTKARKRIIRLKAESALSIRDREFVIEQTGKFITQRSLQIALLESVELLESGEYDEIHRIIEQAVQSGRMATQSDVGLEFTSTADKLTEYSRVIDDMVRAGTGIPILDKLMRGGLEPGKLGIITARAGVGKTMSLINIGVMALLAQLNVVHITLEIDAQETAMRYDARLLGYPINDIRRNLERYSRKIRKVARKIKSKCYIKAWGSSEASTADVRAYLKMLEIKKDFHPDVVIVDYADLLTPARKRNDELLEISDTYRGLRQIARDFNCRVWSASQINKEGYDAETITLRHLYGTHEKSAIPDVILALCMTRPEQRRKRMRIALLKNRQGGGEGTVVDCNINTGTQTISENPDQVSSLRRNGRRDEE